MLIVLDANGNVVGCTETAFMEAAIWTDALLLPGKYKVFVLSLTRWLIPGKSVRFVSHY